jgi:hypothetical protein
VPARIGRFYKYKIFFHNTNGQLKTRKTGTHLSANTSRVQGSLDKLTTVNLAYDSLVLGSS